MTTVAILGPALVAGSATQITLHDRTVLCWLVIRRGTVTTPRWLAAREPAGDQHEVSGTVSRLRHAGVGVHRLAAGWMLDEHTTIDADVFGDLVARARARIAVGRLAAASDDLAAALPLWRGTPYPELAPHPDAADEIERLTAAQLDALEAHNHLALHSEIDFRFVARLRALAAGHPYRVTLHHQLAIALARTGARAQAVAVLDNLLIRYRRAAGERVGATAELRQALLARAPIRHDDPRAFTAQPPGRT